MDGKYQVDDEFMEWFDELSEARRAILGIRLDRALEGLEEQSEEWYDVARQTMLAMFMQDVLEGLVEKGLVEAQGVDADGNIMYRAVVE